jgi:O-antigen/teichoic acid export membrane protein
MLATFFRVGANLIVLPLVLAFVSPEELAIWWVFLSLGAFANLADFGFGQVISRVYSYLWAGAEDFDAEGLRPPPTQHEPNLPRIRALNVTVRFLYSRVALGAVAVLAVAGTFFLLKPIGSLSEPGRVWVLWPVYLVVIGYNLATSHWLLASQGTNRVRQMHLAHLWSSLVYSVLVSALLWGRLGLGAMVIASAVRGLVLRHFASRAYHGAVPRLRGVDLKPDRTILARLWPNARKFGILAIGGFLIAQGSVLVSSNFLSLTETDSFGLTNQIANFIVNFAVLWLGVKWPQLTMMRTQGRLQEMAVLFARRLGLVMLTYLALAAVVLLLGNPLLALKGSAHRLVAFPQLLVFLAYMGLQTFYVQFGMLALTENTVPFFKVGLATGLTMITLSVILTPLLGLWGLILAPLIAEAGYSAWFTIRVGFAGQPLSWGQLARAAIIGRV